jgi:pyrimidine deaminase RibD-like protein
MAEATLFRGATVYDGTGADPVRADLLVRDGRVIGEGWHTHFGGPHAEPTAAASEGQVHPL